MCRNTAAVNKLLLLKKKKKKLWTESVLAMALMHEYESGFYNYVTFAYTFICPVMCHSQLAY